MSKLREAGLLLVTLALTSACSETDPVLLIRNVAVVDVVAGKVLPRQDLEIRGKRITAIGSDLSVPRAATVVEADRLFAIPGLWDMHAHLAGLDSIPRAPEVLVSYGITGIRDMGGRTADLVALRAAITLGRRLGPAMVIAGPTLNGAVHADFHRLVSSPDQAGPAVQQIRAAGADFVKVHNAVAPPTFFAICKAAAQAHVDVVGHVPHGVGTLEASQACLKSIEHAEVLMEAELHDRDNPATGLADALGRLSGDTGRRLFESLRRNGTAFTPTLSAYKVFVEDQENAQDRVLGERLYSRLAEVVAVAHEAGVVILAGTDFRADPGKRLHAELKRLVEDAHFSPLEALRSATVNASRFLELADQGTLEPGQVANIVLLEADPLVDIANSTRIAGVVLGGRYLGSDDLQKLREGE